MTLSPQKPKSGPQDTFSWLDVVTPRQPTILYSTEIPPAEVIEAIKTLNNHTTRKVVVTENPTPQGLIYNFRVEFREVVSQAKDDTLRRHERQTTKQIDGTVMADTEYSTIIEFTPERLTISLQAIAGFFLLLFGMLTLDLPPSLRILFLVGLISMAGTLFLGPYLYVTYGPQNTILEERMTYVLDKLGAVKIEDNRPKRKNNETSKGKHGV